MRLETPDLQVFRGFTESGLGFSKKPRLVNTGRVSGGAEECRWMGFGKQRNKAFQQKKMAQLSGKLARRMNVRLVQAEVAPEPQQGQEDTATQEYLED